MSGPPHTRLGDLCLIQSGGTPRSTVSDYYGGAILWAKIGDLDCPDGQVLETQNHITESGLRSIGGRLFPAGTTLLAMYGSVGKVAVAGKQLSTNQAILGLVVHRHDLLDAGYLRWWLHRIQPELVAAAWGVTQKNISATLVRDLSIPLPPLPEQKRIAAILDKADAIRRKRKKSISLADDFLRSAFLDMFGDPVTNPKGWPTCVLSEIADIASGVTKGRKLDGCETVSVPYMRVANVQDGEIMLDDVANITVLPEDVKRYALQPGDILLTEGGDPDKLGRGAVWHGEISPCIHQNHIFRVRVSGSAGTPEFISALLGSALGKRYFFRCAKQTTGIASINMTQLRQCPMLVPPRDRQQAYTALCGRLREAVSRHESAGKDADMLFQSLSHRAFTGEL